MHFTKYFTYISHLILSKYSRRRDTLPFIDSATEASRKVKQAALGHPKGIFSDPDPNHNATLPFSITALRLDNMKLHK